MDVERTNAEVSSSEAGGTKNPTIEDLADDYFSSVSSIARKLITEKQKRKDSLAKNWDSLSQAEKDNEINDWFIDEGIRLRYEIRMQGGRSMMTTESIFQNYPKLKVPSGAKMVQYSESDQANEVITWRDEFSAPFSWDTKCQQNLGLFGEEVASTPDTSESNLNTSQVSSDLDSSELFSRVKDKSNRLSSGDINIHVNPTFNLDAKVTENGSGSQVSNKREQQPVVTQPRAVHKLTSDQNSKPVVSSAFPVHKPSQPPPAAPGTVTTRTTLTSSRTSQSSISSRSSYSSTSSSRPSQPPPSKPPGITKPSQPPPSAASRRPADMPPLPPQKTKVQSPKATQRPPTKTLSPQPSLSKSSDRGMKETLFSQPLDEIDFRLDLDKPTALTNNADESIAAVASDNHESGEDEKVDTHKDAAFDFLLQW